MTLETKQVLITVKAYPNPSVKYGETVCCAGIDMATASWIRLYPIQYRDLEFSKRFTKYDVIAVKCRKSTHDHRVESYHVDQDSITIVRHLDTKRNWQARKDIVLPTTSASFCRIIAMVEQGASLGMFKPCDVEFSWQRATTDDQAKREACCAQLSFFDRQKKAIERVPFDFYYQFRCSGRQDCHGHKLKIVDWEMGEAYRKWRHECSSEEELLDKIRQKWVTEICSDQNDIYFYVGNMQRFRDQFLVLGVFYPRK